LSKFIVIPQQSATLEPINCLMLPIIPANCTIRYNISLTWTEKLIVVS